MYIVGLDFAVNTNREYNLLKCLSAAYLHGLNKKGSGGKVILKKLSVNGGLCKIQMWCFLYLF